MGDTGTGDFSGRILKDRSLTECTETTERKSITYKYNQTEISRKGAKRAKGKKKQKRYEMIRAGGIISGIMIGLLCYSLQYGFVLAEDLNSGRSISNMPAVRMNYEDATDESDTLISGNETGVSDKRNLKDPALAAAYAFFPGIFLHGAGNYYAGNREVGIIFFISGLISAAGYLLNSMEFIGDYDGGYVPPVDKDRQKSAQVCMIFYFAIWGADMITAPIACKQYNEKIIRKRLSLGPVMKRHDAGNYVAFGINYHF